MAVLLCGAALAAPERTASRSLEFDPRLQTPIRLFRQCILLGDLVEIIAERTGARIELDPADPTLGSLEVTVGSPGTPAWKLLDALVSLNRGSGSWGWQAIGGGTGGFRLTATSRTGARTAARRRVHAVFERHVRLMVEAANLPQEDREALFRKHPELTQAYVPNASTLLGARAFGELAPEQQARVLGGVPVRLAGNQLTGALREVIEQRWSEARQRNPDLGGQAPAEILFAAVSSEENLAPIVVLQVGFLGGQGCLGGKNLEGNLLTADLAVWRADQTASGVPTANLATTVKVPLVTSPPTGLAPGARRPAAQTPGGYLKWLSARNLKSIR